MIRVEAGTLLCIDDSCFYPPALHNISSAVSVADSSTSSRGPRSPPPPISRCYSSNTILSALESDMQSASQSGRNDDVPLFHLDLVFTATCNYIRLPKRELKQALKEENYATTAGDLTEVPFSVNPDHNLTSSICFYSRNNEANKCRKPICSFAY